MTDNLYPDTAWLYDLRPDMRDLGDAGFYIEQAQSAGGPVLELCCGTGRVTIPLALAGVETWGIDLSASMLAQLEEKRARLPQAAQAKLHISRADMTHFQIDRQFALILIPSSSFVLLHERGMQEECLRCIRNHLAPGGLLILDLAKMGPLDESWLRPGEQFRHELADPRTHRRVRQFVERRRLDTAQRKFWVDTIFYVEQPDGSERRFADQLCQTYFSYEQITELLACEGFGVRKAIGGFDGTPLDGGKRMILFCEVTPEYR